MSLPPLLTVMLLAMPPGNTLSVMPLLTLLPVT